MSDLPAFVKVTVEITPAGRHVIARVPIAPGETILSYRGEIVATPTTHTLQIDEHRHLAPTGGPSDFVNHACDPNGAIDFARLDLIALRPIAPGEEVTFDYQCTEWAIAVPFQCRCGAARCRGLIRGFKYLPPSDRRARLPHLAPHLRARLESE